MDGRQGEVTARLGCAKASWRPVARLALTLSTGQLEDVEYMSEARHACRIPCPRDAAQEAREQDGRSPTAVQRYSGPEARGQRYT